MACLLQTTNIRLVSGFVRSEPKTTQSQLGGSPSESIANRSDMIFYYDLFLRG